jgi:hypothetical protein
VPTGVDLEMPARVQAGPGSGDTGRASDDVLVEVESDRAEAERLAEGEAIRRLRPLGPFRGPGSGSPVLPSVCSSRLRSGHPRVLRDEPAGC